MNVFGILIFPLRRMDWLLLPLIIALVSVGYFALLSASSSEALAQRQQTYLMVGGVVMVTCACVPWRWWKYAAAPFYLFTVLLLVAVAVVGVEINNSQRWLVLGSVSLQPSELAKIAIPLMLAWFYCLLRKRYFWQHLVAIALTAVPAMLVFAQPDLGTAVLIAASGLLVIFLAGLSWWLIGGSVLLAASLAPFVWTQLLKEYQHDRILSVIDPYRDPLGAGYHTIQSSIAVGSGGMWGKGFRQGSQSQLGFLPEKHTDFIFAVFAEEYGFIGCMFLLGLIMLLMLRMLTIAGKAQDETAGLVVGALAIAFFAQAAINLGMVSGVLPVVGLPLPLISYGGTSLLTYMMCFGIIMSVARAQAQQPRQFL